MGAKHRHGHKAMLRVITIHLSALTSSVINDIWFLGWRKVIIPAGKSQ